MATLRDVAKLAGVHPSIVSRVLNDDKGASIKPETKRRVLNAARALDYRPNALARGLKMRSTTSFALVIPDIYASVYAEITRGAQLEARESGHYLMLASSPSDDPDKLDFLKALLEGRVDGLIIANALVDDGIIDALEERGYPYVLVNRRSRHATRYVVVDDKGGSQKAVQYLLEQGHRRIGHLAGPHSTDTAQVRMQGYRAALDEAAILFDPQLVVEGSFQPDAGRRGLKTLMSLPSPPTAVFAATVRVAAGALQGARELGLRVPDDVSIICLHDDEGAELVYPPLTAVRMPLEEMGREAVRMLLRIVSGNEGPEAVVVPGSHLIVRGTVGPPRVT